jgi:glyoxylase-like metal-dependent hydrolase (beta-lactamase superfamily II)
MVTRVMLAIAAVLPLVAGAQAPTATTWNGSIQDIRAAASMIPGPRPLRINLLKFAESRRTKNFSVKGAPEQPSVQARTVFQVVFAGGTVMIDAGMDQEVHRFFGRGVQEPYYPGPASEVANALARAKMIVVTHEHGDHVAGVIRTPRAGQLAPKTILTRDQVRTLVTSPQMPQIGLTDEQASRYRVVDYERVYPLAPGVVLVKAPGHTPGSQMVYVVVDSAREYLFIGDVAWHMDSVRGVVGKDAPWVTENQALVLDELRWLNELSRTDPRLVIVASHDDEQHADLRRSGVLGGQLE